eukprot:scaffold7709_cov32-Tisochrysis_lutea.AAC.2
MGAAVFAQLMPRSLDGWRIVSLRKTLHVKGSSGPLQGCVLHVADGHSHSLGSLSDLLLLYHPSGLAQCTPVHSSPRRRMRSARRRPGTFQLVSLVARFKFTSEK